MPARSSSSLSPDSGRLAPLADREPSTLSRRQPQTIPDEGPIDTETRSIDEVELSSALSQEPVERVEPR